MSEPTKEPVCQQCGSEGLAFDMIDEPTEQRHGYAIFHCLSCGQRGEAALAYGWRHPPTFQP